MNLIAVTRVLNEEDIVEPLIRHHAALVDHHVVLDNGSVDRTMEILLALKAEGLPLTILQNDSVMFSETQFNTVLYDLCVERFAADWVIYLDADEFIDTRPVADFRAFLDGVADEHASVGVQLINYDAPTAATRDEVNVVRKFVRRLRAPIDAWKVFVRGNIGVGRVTVDAGNHHIFIDGAQQAALRQTQLRLAHFPNRSPLHWAGKAVTGRFKVIAAGETETRQNRAQHYNRLVEILKTNPKDWAVRALASTERLETTEDLVTDPIAYLGAALKYTRPPDYGSRALSLLLANYEKLARAYGAQLDDDPALREKVYAQIRSLRVVASDVDLPPTIAAPARTAPDIMVRVATKTYACATLEELAAESGAVRCIARQRPASLHLPPLAFGDTDLTRPGLAFLPPGGEGAATGVASAYLLQGALVHGAHGIITIGERVVAESLACVPAHALADAEWRRTGTLTLPERPLSVTVHSAYHLLPGELGNYYHWLIDALARFDREHYRSLAEQPDISGAPPVLLPTLDVFWKWESVGLLLSNAVPRIALAPQGHAFVQRLLYVPDLSGGMFAPHPALLGAFDAMRAAALGAAPAPPFRRLYISRADSGNRVLSNEAEVIARAGRAGFTPVLLSKLSVADQVRLFAEASHVLAPHGAGLTNIGFCHPGTALCELHMDGYVHWAFRCLAAARGVRYGCLIGATDGPRAPVIHDNTWHVDLAALDAVLADTRFGG